MFHLFHAPRAYPAAFAPYYDRFNFYEGRQAWLTSIDGVPEPAVHLFALHWLHLEVHNGGFWQYMFNDTGTTAPEALAGYRAIGMAAVAQIVADAMDRVGTPFPGRTEARRKIVGGPAERADFTDLDTRFYDLADTEQVFRRKPKFVPLADAYAAAHFPQAV